MLVHTHTQPVPLMGAGQMTCEGSRFPRYLYETDNLLKHRLGSYNGTCGDVDHYPYMCAPCFQHIVLHLTYTGIIDVQRNNGYNYAMTGTSCIHVTMSGAARTPYAGGTYKLEFKCSAYMYPMSGPVLRIRPPLFHPFVSPDGTMAYDWCGLCCVACVVVCSSGWSDLVMHVQLDPILVMHVCRLPTLRMHTIAMDVYDTLFRNPPGTIGWRKCTRNPAAVATLTRSRAEFALCAAEHNKVAGGPDPTLLRFYLRTLGERLHFIAPIAQHILKYITREGQWLN